MIICNDKHFHTHIHPPLSYPLLFPVPIPVDFFLLNYYGLTTFIYFSLLVNQQIKLESLKGAQVEGYFQELGHIPVAASLKKT